MADNTYKEALIKEIAQLKKENVEITEHIRPQTLEAMKTKSPDAILKRVSVAFFAKRILILIAALILIGGIALIAGSFIREMATPYAEDQSINDPSFIPDTTEGFNKTGSTTAHPQIAIQDEIFYLSDGAYIYKYINGKKITVTEGAATHLNVYKYCLYYYDSNDRAIYRIRTDGKEKTTLIKNISVADLKVYNNTLYALTDGGDIHKIYINGKNGYLFMEGEDILSFTVTDGYMYYINKDGDSLSLYRTKFSSQEKIKVSDTESTLIAVSEGYVFYLYNGTLFGLNKEEEKAHAFFSGKVKEFALLNESLLVLEENILYLASVKGMGIEKIAEDIDSLAEIPLANLMSYGAERQADR